MYEEGDDDHDTPGEFVEPLIDAVSGFDLDPSASTSSNLAERNVTKDEDGLSIPWHGDVWLNPPYSTVSDWLEYARNEYHRGAVDSIISLVFARTSTQWFHNHATTADLACFVEGRLSFGEAANSAPAPSLVLVWGDAAENTDVVEYLSSQGFLVKLRDRDVGAQDRLDSFAPGVNACEYSESPAD
ncbi:DNA N-6-adenine-methyltransferase [Halorhabdus tiamatea]|uniref:DNA N-6-adenine-methyltransferase n=1 Tax=Halorhabdus tiamatea TaxID=430914 RepID=UPI0018E09826|nr:DNA N-6-adenine-methyltransferase [Halorhabdus tiamatea]